MIGTSPMTGSIDDVVPEWYGIAYPSILATKAHPAKAGAAKPRVLASSATP
jgi:hypothetical protein